MDKDGPLARGRNLQLANEPPALHFARRALVVVVEADLPAGNHLRLGQQAVQLCQRGIVGLVRVVRIDSRARVEPRKAGAAFGP